MKVQIISQTGTGSSTPLVINTNATPVNIGFGAVVSGTVNYDVQYSFDSPATGFVTWFPSTVAAQTTNQTASILFPITGIKLVVNSGSGSVTLSVVQAGIA